MNQDQSQEEELGFLTGGKQSRKKLFVEVCQEIELLRPARQKSREIQRRMDSENVGTFRKTREDDWTQSDLLLPFRAGRTAVFTQHLTCGFFAGTHSDANQSPGLASALQATWT